MKWKTAKLGSICRLINGKAFKPSDWSDEGEPIIRIQNLNDSQKPFNYWNGSIEKQVIVRPGNLLFAWSGTPGTSFGAHIWNGPSGVLNQHIFRVDLDEGVVEKKWWASAVNFQLNELIGQAHGGVGLKHVTKGMVDSLEIPLPPLEEQKRIVAILDQADALRRLRARALDRLNALGQAIFHEMFVAHGKSYNEVTLMDVCTKITDGTHKTPTYVETGVPFISAKNIREFGIEWQTDKFIHELEHLELKKRCNPQFGDVLICKSGSLGRSAIVDRDVEFSLFESAALLKLDRSKIAAPFLVNLLRSNRIQRALLGAQKGVGVRHLHLVDIRNLTIPLPSLSEQDEFAKQLEHKDEMRSRVALASAKVELLFNSLQQRAFRGLV